MEDDRNTDVVVKPAQVEQLMRVLGLPAAEAVEAAITGYLKVLTWIDTGGAAGIPIV